MKLLFFLVFASIPYCFFSQKVSFTAKAIAFNKIELTIENQSNKDLIFIMDSSNLWINDGKKYSLNYEMFLSNIFIPISDTDTYYIPFTKSTLFFGPFGENQDLSLENYVNINQIKINKKQKKIIIYDLNTQTNILQGEKTMTVCGHIEYNGKKIANHLKNHNINTNKNWFFRKIKSNNFCFKTSVMKLAPPIPFRE